MRDNPIRECEDCGESYDYTKPHKCDLFDYLKWQREKDCQVDLFPDDIDEILKLKSERDELKAEVERLLKDQEKKAWLLYRMYNLGRKGLVNELIDEYVSAGKTVTHDRRED